MLAEKQLLRGYHIYKTTLGEHHPKTLKAHIQADNGGVDGGGLEHITGVEI